MHKSTHALLAALFSSLAIPVLGDVYTWTDASGRVQYSDHPPRNFSGVVKRIEPDEKPTPGLVAPKAVPAKPEPAKAGPASATPVKKDMAGKRREERERLDEALSAAREKLAHARKALAESQDPQPDEHQIVLRPGGAPGSMPMPGVVPAASRSNCRAQIDKDGRKTTVCPVSMPTEAYFERIAGLEAAVKAAEEELVQAERAYRRGVD